MRKTWEKTFMQRMRKVTEWDREQLLTHCWIEDWHFWQLNERKTKFYYSMGTKMINRSIWNWKGLVDKYSPCPLLLWFLQFYPSPMKEINFKSCDTSGTCFLCNVYCLYTNYTNFIVSYYTKPDRRKITLKINNEKTHSRLHEESESKKNLSSHEARLWVKERGQH